MNLLELLAYGTPEGVKKEWDTRGRKEGKLPNGLTEKQWASRIYENFRDMVANEDAQDSLDELIDHLRGYEHDTPPDVFKRMFDTVTSKYKARRRNKDDDK